MKKQVPLKWYSEANRILNKYDIEASNSVMIGLPGESRSTIQKWIASNNVKIDGKICNQKDN